MPANRSKLLPFPCRPIQKRQPYLLLEVLIAFALVALCALPLIRPHVELARQKESLVRDLQLERWADDSIALIRERLFEHRIEWNDLGHGKVRPKKKGGSLPPVQVKLSNGESVTYQRSFVVGVEKPYWKSNYATYRLLEVNLKIWRGRGDIHEYPYKLFIERNDEA